MTIIYFIDNKLGGVSALNLNLIKHVPSGIRQEVIHLHQEEWEMTPSQIEYPVDRQQSFSFSSIQHYYHTLARLRQCIPDEPGALVVNYGTEMAMLDHHPVKQTVYQLVHDDYNVRLACKYGHVVDVFICHNRVIEEKLKALLPDRHDTIFYRPHGVPVSNRHTVYSQDPEPLRLFFLGRMTESKGIFDLPAIDAALKARQCKVQWTLAGDGPSLANLQAKWKTEVGYCKPPDYDSLVETMCQQDVFVLPTKFEGSPVSLLETMSVGLVPVITALPGGIMETVDVQNGFTVAMDDIDGFVQAISQLCTDRSMLQTMGAKARQTIQQRFDVAQTAGTYHALFAAYEQWFRPKTLKKIRVGARLDHPAIPELITRSIRSLTQRKKMA